MRLSAANSDCDEFDCWDELIPERWVEEKKINTEATVLVLLLYDTHALPAAETRTLPPKCTCAFLFVVEKHSCVANFSKKKVLAFIV